MSTLDPITLSVIQSGLQQVCDEMDLSFSRAAFSPVIAEANDRSDGIYSAEDGSLIAQGSQGLPVFVGTMQYSTRTLIEWIADGRAVAPKPGDIYIVNDPYRTPVGTHSVMFLGWQDRARGIARTISHAGWGAPRVGRESTYDISRTYRIVRPTL